MIQTNMDRNIGKKQITYYKERIIQTSMDRNTRKKQITKINEKLTIISSNWIHFLYCYKV